LIAAEYISLTFFHSRSSDAILWGYANPRVDELIDAFTREMVTYARDGLAEEVWRIVLEDIVYIPLHQQMFVWAMRENLDLPVYPYNYPKFREAWLK
jgi:peptide/nickel transport system substrate-binding protein